MLALAYWEGGLCRRCGEHLSQSMDPMTDPDRPEATQRWVAEDDECFCCKAMVRADKALRDGKDRDPDAPGYTIHTPALVPTRPRTRQTR